MRNRLSFGWLAGWLLGAGLASLPAQRHASASGPSCKAEIVDGELTAGHEFRASIGGGLALWFQPIASGWILRVIPTAGPPGDADYAELATPPWQSVSPLSLSTDFSFRAQDAVGWNPRHFRWASSRAEYDRLHDLYLRTLHAGVSPPTPLEVELSGQIARAPEGSLTILDTRLIPGMADQGPMAASVAAHFTSTAHTLADPPDGRPDPLGKLLWLRFRVRLDLPPGFRSANGSHEVPQVCGIH